MYFYVYFLRTFKNRVEIEHCRASGGDRQGLVLEAQRDNRTNSSQESVKLWLIRAMGAETMQCLYVFLCAKCATTCLWNCIIYTIKYYESLYSWVFFLDEIGHINLSGINKLVGMPINFISITTGRTQSLLNKRLYCYCVQVNKVAFLRQYYILTWSDGL